MEQEYSHETEASGSEVIGCPIPKYNDISKKYVEDKVNYPNNHTSYPNKVNHPSHYTSHPSGVECIQITRHHGFCIGNAIKYLWRAGLKTEKGYDSGDKEIEDLEKAVFYIKDRITQLKTEKIDRYYENRDK